MILLLHLQVKLLLFHHFYRCNWPLSMSNKQIKWTICWNTVLLITHSCNRGHTVPNYCNTVPYITVLINVRGCFFEKSAIFLKAAKSSTKYNLYRSTLNLQYGLNFEVYTTAKSSIHELYPVSKCWLEPSLIWVVDFTRWDDIKPELMISWPLEFLISLRSRSSWTRVICGVQCWQ